jgi:hypothetical protein
MAQGEQRRSSIFNIRRGNPDDATVLSSSGADSDQIAEVAIPRQMSREILRLIAQLRPQPPRETATDGHGPPTGAVDGEGVSPAGEGRADRQPDQQRAGSGDPASPGRRRQEGRTSVEPGREMR